MNSVALRQLTDSDTDYSAAYVYVYVHMCVCVYVYYIYIYTHIHNTTNLKPQASHSIFYEPPGPQERKYTATVRNLIESRMITLPEALLVALN